MAVTETVVLVSGTTWTVPNTWNSSNNTIICIGGGAGGRSAIDGGGGGGGARVTNSNVTLTPGSTVSYAIGAGGGAGSAGGDTTFNSSAMVAKGGSSTATSTGGAGGSAASSTGTTKYSGGTGGSTRGGGGGAAGNTANGSNGSNSSGNGGAGGATGGGAGGAGGSASAGGNGDVGYDDGSKATGFATNYAGGGGGGGGTFTDKFGTTYYAGGSGGFFGGGGGGGNGGGSGAQGAIIISWNWQTTLPSSGDLLFSDINTSIKRIPTNEINLNESNVRTVSNVTVTNSQISANDFYNKNDDPTFVTSSLVNINSGVRTYNLPSGIQVGDLVIFWGIFGTSVRGQMISSGWTFTGNNSVAVDTSTGYFSGAFYRVFQSGDTSISFRNNNDGYAAVFSVFRGPSRAIARGKVDNGTGTTLTFSGITKSAISKRLFTFVIDRDPSTNATAPSGWTEHTRHGATNFALESASIRSINYTNNTTIGWTNFVNGFRQTGVLLELE
jgi:hypothetical protein